MTQAEGVLRRRKKKKRTPRSPLFVQVLSLLHNGEPEHSSPACFIKSSKKSNKQLSLSQRTLTLVLRRNQMSKAFHARAGQASRPTAVEMPLDRRLDAPEVGRGGREAGVEVMMSGQRVEHGRIGDG